MQLSLSGARAQLQLRQPQAAAAAAPQTAAPKAAKGGIASFFAPRAAAPPVVVVGDDVELVESEHAVAAAAAGRALAALVKSPLDAAALARQADILKQGKRDAAKESNLAKPRSLSVNDGGKRDRKAASGRADGNSAPAKKAKSTATRRVSSGGKVCKVTPETRLREFRSAKDTTLGEEGFVVNVANRQELFCTRCNKAVKTFADRIHDHLSTHSHVSGAAKVARQLERLQYIDEALAAARQLDVVASGAHEDEGGISDKVVKYRLEVLEGWLAAGCDLEKLDAFRPTMEKYAHMPLTVAGHMRELVPILRTIEVKVLRAWLKDKYMGLALDGASMEGECFGLTARIINESFVPETRCIAVRRYESSFSGTQQAAVNQICFQLEINMERILMIARDRAACGKVCFDTLKPFVPNAIDSECFAHSLSHVGEHARHASLTQFYHYLSYIWTVSAKGKVAWEEAVGMTPPTSSSTRWWSWWECMYYMMRNWSHVGPYLAALKDNEFCKESVSGASKLLYGWEEVKAAKPAIPATPAVPAAPGVPAVAAKPAVAAVPSRTIKHPPMQHSIMLELAAIVDWGEQIRQVTALVESDGLVAMDLYDLLLRLEYAIKTPVWPNVTAVSRKYHLSVIPSDAPNLVELLRRKMEKDLVHAQNVVAPANKYFMSHFGSIESCGAGNDTGEMNNLVTLYKCARIVNPFKAHALFRAGSEVVQTQIDDFARVFPLLKRDNARVIALKKELPEYLVCTQHASMDPGLDAADASQAMSAWWAAHASRLPAWSALARHVFLLVPSSAAVERVFSILRNTFGKEQKSAGEDLMELSMFLQYNRRPGAGQQEQGLPPQAPT